MAALTATARSRGHDPDVKLASAEELDSIRRLAQIVARIFYEDKHIILMDQLVSITVLPADVLAHRLGIQVKDLAALAIKLLDDKLICTFRRNETKDNVHNRTFQRTYYYLDYKLFLDVTKWKMVVIRNKIDKKLRNELENKGYVCPRCKRSFSTLEVAHLLDFIRNVFVCDNPGCNTELVDNEDAEDVQRSKESLTRFNEQLGIILGGLRRVENVTLPPLDVGAWLNKHAASQPWHARRRDADGSLPSSTLPPPSHGMGATTTLQVDLSYNDPASEAARLKAKQIADEEQRKQNALPAWHLASTVSGEQTALGKKQATNAIVGGNINEESTVQEDAEDADYYSQYAALQAQSEEQPTESVPYEEDLDEEDFEDVETTTNTDAAPSRKRSRSGSTSTPVTDQDTKRSKLDQVGNSGNAEDEDDMDDFEEVV
ncbi:hypothetical protein IE53DRAFT_384952 [Violaceomyces palustris]|uniref:Uncharacterized protein n=1 Tax=Violaceomyces palustris TaxID=1673888 RepID=A0ACD0P369_9BASI|nr:hypothetical protein IE53DRAFT_384952 [Violaceomyces palustris]